MSRRMGRDGGGGGRGRGSQAVSVFIRNLHHECRQDDVRKAFGKYGDISDVYIPMDYQTREPRGFGYVQFNHIEDAEDAVYYLDGTSLFGRVLEVQVAQGDRKSASQMRNRGGGNSFRRGRSFSRSRSRSRSPRRRSGGGGDHRRRYTRSRSRSPSNHKVASRSKSRSRSKSK